MAELRDVAAAVRPTDTLLVVDAMTGQEAATLAAAFGAAAPLTGAVLTKMDGDARGGAALSVRAVSGAPIKFVGAGEGLDALEPFYPDRLAGRILGMGDVLTLVEKAETAVKAQKGWLEGGRAAGRGGWRAQGAPWPAPPHRAPPSHPPPSCRKRTRPP